MKKPINTTITRRGLARKSGVAHSLVNRAVLEGRLDRAGDKIDLAGPLTREFIASQKARLEAVSASPDRPPVPVGPRSRPDVAETPDRPRYASKQAAEICRLERQIRRFDLLNARAEVDNARNRNELVPREATSQIFQRWFAIEKTELSTLGDRLAPEILAVARRNADDSTATIAISQLIAQEIPPVLAHIDDMVRRFFDTFPTDSGAKHD